ncbi:MAG: DMT family transporter, partial [Nitrospiraceae bacterium]
MPDSRGWLRTAFLTALALLAFASNSVLCRMALREATVDAASFSTIRLVSGAAVLLLIAALRKRSQETKRQGNWASPALLFLYAVPFSFAYMSLAAGTGALILFAAVQATMILVGLWSGERPHYMEWVGHLVALVGLVYLVFPGLSAPSPMGSFLMMIAGIAWGVYSLRGRGAVDPIGDTTNNFVRSVPFVIVISLITLGNIHVSAEGILLAVLSGALASGMGYVVWYAALRGLTATRAAMV